MFQEPNWKIKSSLLKSQILLMDRSKIKKGPNVGEMSSSKNERERYTKWNEFKSHAQ